ncbi:dentilisin complex subunit PrcB [Treponema pedis]|uniref:Dentilisin component prcB like protein n=1 Tax=Treponema pedis str. T A4 TaxID=1291379 RepID=S6A4G8_9SPIR|nr:dentilisin complex subunit PrcB [Treponema pedis]AGT44426.1 dentilisin component prcB like protein [Treponema pedis str. T A4]
MKYYVVSFLLFLSLSGCKTFTADNSSGTSYNGFQPHVHNNLIFSAKANEKHSEKNELFEDSKICYEVLISGTNIKNGIPSLIRNQDELNRLYSVLYGGNLKPPKIDFNKNAVVAVSAGPFSTGGYSIELVSAIKTNNILNLLFRVKEPAWDEAVTQAFTRPYLIISINAEPSTVIIVNTEDMQNGKGF